jgi:hypothetical protein
MSVSVPISIQRYEYLCSNLAIVLSIPKIFARWRRNLKGLPHERGSAKSAEKYLRLTLEGTHID